VKGQSCKRASPGDIDVDADTDPSVLYDGPLVLLISRFSASASESWSARFKTMDAAWSWVFLDLRKGTVQNILPLAFVMDKMDWSMPMTPAAQGHDSQILSTNGASTSYARRVRHCSAIPQ